ncbi:hypothetical protein HYALB_00001557 [Hymenoscyphus albidus]|uniref:Uncharacterized protein n=1 Tax=Hymenoscyphus albidus TaxID=595503 RepID=A0A9N9Q2A1_9HELO|nr:hypothetical protein HYALB_00001557 [Hymenoscyphus albidus]
MVKGTPWSIQERILTHILMQLAEAKSREEMLQQILDELPAFANKIRQWTGVYREYSFEVLDHQRIRRKGFMNQQVFDNYFGVGEDFDGVEFRKRKYEVVDAIYQLAPHLIPGMQAFGYHNELDWNYAQITAMHFIRMSYEDYHVWGWKSFAMALTKHAISEKTMDPISWERTEYTHRRHDFYDFEVFLDPAKFDPEA